MRSFRSFIGAAVMILIIVGWMIFLFGSDSGHRLPFLSTEPNERSLVAVMIENQETARKYHRGIGEAQMVIEMLVEGGISRFAVLFDRHELPADMGPIRSLRPYFIDAVLPYAKTIVHAGGSPEAFEEAGSIKSLTTINALGYGMRDVFYRDDIAPAPHNLFAHDTLTTLLPDDPVIAWPPFETGSRKNDVGTGALTIDINFFSKNHNIQWTYDAWEHTYTRVNGDIESALHPSTIVIMEAPITNIGEFGRLTIPLEGSGKVYIFRDGTMMEGTREKASRDAPFVFTADDGSVIPLEEGPVWIMVLATLDRVTWNAE